MWQCRQCIADESREFMSRWVRVATRVAQRALDSDTSDFRLALSSLADLLAQLDVASYDGVEMAVHTAWDRLTARLADGGLTEANVSRRITILAVQSHGRFRICCHRR
jgi:hypothetical protein